MKQFFLGLLMMGFAVAALFFLKFWRQSRDRLFAGFAIAFGVLSLNQLALLLTDERSEARTGAYVVRLIGFAILLWAIIDKNRARD